MIITFSDRKLKRVANDEKKIIKKYGQELGKKIKIRLDQLRAAETLEDLRYAPGK